ncbi:MAG: hypothetical protein IAE81_06450 [Caldilineaceae bacterium]|nr:hypothetical protein [Caldilineaceae bacterium]
MKPISTTPGQQSTNGAACKLKMAPAVQMLPEPEAPPTGDEQGASPAAKQRQRVDYYRVVATVRPAA